MTTGRNRDLEGLICAARKDYDLLPLALKQLWKHAPVSHVFLITEDLAPIDGLSDGASYTRISDDDALPFPLTGLIGSRPKWFKQQFIKLLNVACERPWRLVVDADTMLTMPYDPFPDGKPLWFYNPALSPRGQESYLQFNRELFGPHGEDRRGFVSECCLYDLGILKEMVAGLGGESAFIARCIDIMGRNNGWPAESELYMGYVSRNHPQRYHLRQIRTELNGRYMHMGDRWTRQEVADLVRAAEEKGTFDYIAYHHWN